MTIGKPMKGVDLEDPSKLVFPYYGSFKLDGYRAFTADGVMRTSSGAPIANDFTREHFSKPHFEGLDGELIVGAWNHPKAFSNTSGPMKKKSVEPDVRWFIFDDRTEPNHTFVTRLDSFKRRVADEQARHCPAYRARIEVIPQRLITDLAQLAIIEAEAIAGGFEGVMLKKPTGQYKFGRATENEDLLWKVKRMVHEECVIRGFKEAMSSLVDSKVTDTGNRIKSSKKADLVPTGMIGAFECHSEKWGDFDIQVSSMTHDERREALQCFDTMYRGNTARFHYFAHGVVDKPRHGMFDGLRSEEDMSE
jgi:DNA ligase 1